MGYRLLLIAFLILSAFDACKTKQTIPTDDKKDDITEKELPAVVDTLQKAELDTLAIRQNIKHFIDGYQSDSSLHFKRVDIPVYPALLNFYNKYDYEPAWLNKTQHQIILDHLRNAHLNGLNPDDYYVSRIETLTQQALREGDEKPVLLAKLDVLITHSLYHYASHLISGKLNPESLDPFWNYSQRRLPNRPDSLLRKAIHEDKLEEMMKGLEPRLPQYQLMKQLLADYRQRMDEKRTYDFLEFPGKTLKPGDSSSVILALKKRLESFGALNDEPPTNIFDESLEKAIKAFQKQHGLMVDGLPGKKTFERLNLTTQDYIDMLRVNMERLRWFDDDLPEEYLLVNIADFKLYLRNRHELVYQNKVVVGKAFTETPVIQSRIHYIEFNPTWTVPYSISSKELLPKIQKDSTYLGKNHMKLYLAGKEVAANSIDFTSLSENNFPYTIVQQPGPWNALGTMKFIFPNEHAVYLHDTPSQHPFYKDERAFSHGCVRVYQPRLLAELLLKKQGVDMEQIESILKSEETQRIHLKEKMPVMLVYLTCYEAVESGQVYFYRDIYQRDQRVLNALNKKR
jgi:murein L,D-transpeptidase YcbB/YkuD